MESLPGLSDGRALAVEDSNESHTLTIPKGSEWRVERPSEARLTIRIKSGIAEIFGTELANDVEYDFRNFNFSIFAVEDVTLEWKCPEISSQNLQVVPNTTSKLVYNLHFALEKMRCSSFEGPRVIVIGSDGSGKTALCRTLCSYAIKFKPFQPMFINTNPQEGIFSPPGCVTAVPISDILDVQCSTWGQSMTSGATPLHSKQPFVKNFGLERISDNRTLFTRMVNELALVVSDRLAGDALVRRSGCIIDTPPLSHLDDDGQELENMVRQFKVNAIIAIGDDADEVFEKYSARFMPYIGPNFIRIPKLSGCISTDDVYKRLLQRSAIREYFYGNYKTVLSPYAVGADIGDVNVWKPKNIMELPESEVGVATDTEMLPVEVTASNLQHSLVAISYADRKSSPVDVEHAPILGFALITEVNEKRNKLRILLPVPGRLPNKAITLTSYRYLE
ncbi:hypothetical protein ZYGR_0AS03270 [Zygosaccharomyces rouxii]|uniref:Polynucleotide 5'-hydroxyl-kinase GRC3 n=1 Tax=Zygosaccharomyces rouxii TaxID=4956 RepID=A0A1Q3AGY3_ZYGRO|nr:hypothetical protein ZYGR_0AS03270 [Zygosaccharomyces rouxii]